jgi:hypothetical protein
MSESKGKNRSILAACYLLGRLSPEEQLTVEEGVFADEEWFAEVRQAENDLIDAYAGGSLSPEDCKRVEERILVSPIQQQKLQIAAALQRIFAEQPVRAMAGERVRPSVSPRASFSMRYRLMGGLSAAVAAGIVLSVLLVRSERENLALKTQAKVLAAANSAPQPAAVTPAIIDRPVQAVLPSSPASLAEVETFFLPVGVTRGDANSKPLAIASQTQVLHLQLEVHPKKKTQKFEARIVTADQKPAWNASSLVPQTRDDEAWLNLWVPVNVLRGQECEVRVWPKDTSDPEVDSYFLQVASPGAKADAASSH